LAFAGNPQDKRLAFLPDFLPLSFVPASYLLRWFFGCSSVGTEAVPKKVRSSTEEHPKKGVNFPGKITMGKTGQLGAKRDK
jgi:hypothetical protein